MRFITNNISDPKVGDLRTKIKFLIFPKCLRNLDNKLEKRWLEIAAIEEIYQERLQIFGGICSDVVGWWENRWMN